MKLTDSELELLAANSLSIDNAASIGEQIENDLSVGGIFPDGSNGNFDNPNEALFKSKWCSWWPVAKILLTIAKTFTGPAGDKVIDALISLGNRVCPT